MSKIFLIFVAGLLLQTQVLALGVDYMSQIQGFDLSGGWTQPCFVTGEDEDWLTSHLTFSSEGPLLVEWTRRAYEEENCQKPYLDYTIMYSASWLTETGEVDLQVMKVLYVIQSAEVARALNLVAFGGLQNWKKGVVQEVSGRDCDGYLQPQVGQNVFGRLKVEMRQSKQIFWGRASARFDGSHTETRFQEFEEVGYQKNRQ